MKSNVAKRIQAETPKEVRLFVLKYAYALVQRQK